MADADNRKVRQIDLGTGEVSTLASHSDFNGWGVTVSPDGEKVYIFATQTQLIEIDRSTGTYSAIVGKTPKSTRAPYDGVGTNARMSESFALAASLDGKSVAISET